MFDLRNPVASANITTGFITSGIHCISVVASSLVSHLTRISFFCLTLIVGDFPIHFQSLTAALKRERKKARYLSELAEQMEREQAERKAQEVAEQARGTEE